MNEENSPIDKALHQFDATVANLNKLDRLFKEIRDLIPEGVSFGSNFEYQNRISSFEEIWKALPKIDGWKTNCSFFDLNDLAQRRFDILEVGEPIDNIYIEEEIEEPFKQLAEYRYRLNRKRLQLIRGPVLKCMSNINRSLFELQKNFISSGDRLDSKVISNILTYMKEIDILLGDNFNRPEGWSELREKLNSKEGPNLTKILSFDWPNINSAINLILDDKNEPIKIDVEDIGELAKTEPQGPITTSLKWNNLSPQEFERLMYALISDTVGYENPEWLMETNAPDRGRDLSVTRVYTDGLSGVKRQRVVIQCKHMGKSISISEIATLLSQLILWEPPKINVLIIATTGRFSADAVSYIEKYNQSNNSIQIEMWPNSHLELILAKRPALIAEFKLK